MNERQARTHPRKNVLAQALGAGNQHIRPQIGQIHCEPGDRLLLCSDGVIEGLWDRGLDDLLRHPPPAAPTDHSPAELSPAQRLVQTAVAESGRDNATAVVVEIV